MADCILMGYFARDGDHMVGHPGIRGDEPTGHEGHIGNPLLRRHEPQLAHFQFPRHDRRGDGGDPDAVERHAHDLPPTRWRGCVAPDAWMESSSRTLT